MRIGLLMLDTTRAFGQIYTIANPFQLTAFQGWADRADLPHKPVLEPFAGQIALFVISRVLAFVLPMRLLTFTQLQRM